MNKLIYLKSYALNQLFQNSIVIKKETLDYQTRQLGIKYFKELLKRSFKKIE